MVKNRVVPATSSASSTTSTKDITSDTFFSTSSGNSNSKNVPRDKFFGREKINGEKQFKNRGVDSRSKNIQKVKNIRSENQFNSKNKNGTTTKFNQNKIKNIFNKPHEKFRQIEEDAEYNMQAKNKCRDIVKYDGKQPEKSFDKKTWRLQKYSKKYKLDQWEEKRKKAVLKEYYQQTKNEKPKIDINKIYEQYDSDNEEKPKPRKNYVQHPDYKQPEENEYEQKAKKSTKRKVQLELERIKQEKQDKKEELLKQKQEREDALKLYKQKKYEKQKQLNKKTKRGQPVMKGRIEMLLDRIQNS